MQRTDIMKEVELYERELVCEGEKVILIQKE